MHIQVITFRLSNMTPARYVALCDELAPTFAAIPGLLAKTWLANSESGLYGGVYHWRDRAAMETANVFGVVRSYPDFTEASSRDYPVLEGPTRITHGPDAATVRRTASHHSPDRLTTHTVVVQQRNQEGDNP